jgi:hypothetical protein
MKDLIFEAGVRAQVNESQDSKQTRSGSKNGSDGITLRDPNMYFIDLVLKIGFDFRDAYYQSPRDLFTQVMKARQHATGKQNCTARMGKCSSINIKTVCSAPQLPPNYHEDVFPLVVEWGEW